MAELYIEQFAHALSITESRKAGCPNKLTNREVASKVLHRPTAEMLTINDSTNGDSISQRLQYLGTLCRNSIVYLSRLHK